MKRFLLYAFAFIMVIAGLHACKLDPPILPGQPGYVQQYPPNTGDTGSTGTTGTTGSTGSTSIDTTLLDGKWVAQTTYSGGYIDGSFQQGAESPIAFLPDVQIISSSKKGVLGYDTFPDTTTYSISVTNNKFYITFGDNPVSLFSKNVPMQITALSATSMTWLSVDPDITTVGGHTTQNVITTIYKKQ